MATTEKSAGPVIEVEAEATDAEGEELEADDVEGASEALLALLAGGSEASAPPAIPDRIQGVVVGRLLGLDGGAMVAWAGAPDGARARVMAALEPKHVGGDVALMFEEGDPMRAIVMGPIERFERGLAVTEEGEGEERRVVLRADRELVLACGKASITLTRAGKVLIKGAYVSSHASGTQRIRGGTVEIN
jgi:hypothetical protein